jgi:regulator of sigma E protease
VNILISVVLVLAILVVLVVIHELGHFVVARLAGVRVHEFGIGFPPRAAIIGRDHETVYTLNWLPIGGFVRLEGEEGESDDPRAFVNAPVLTRLLILLAGVAMNLVLAWAIFSAIAGIADPVTTVQLGCVQPGSPAATIGLVGGTQTGATSDGTPICDATGDTIVAIDGQHFPAFDDMNSGDAPLRYLREHQGEAVTLTVQHADGSVEDRQVTLRVPAAGQGALGVSSLVLSRDLQVQHDPVTAMKLGLARTVDASTLIFNTVAGLFTNANDSLTNPQVSGPIGIVSAVDTVRTQLPPVFLFWLIGLLSANLAVVNALPLPPLDGGRIFMTVLQKLSGNRVTPAFERAFYLAGFIFLLTFLVWISYFDITRGVS